MRSEAIRRSLLKTASYRIVVIALLAIVTFAFTGNPGEATTITIVFNIGGTIAYYVFERLWDAIPWGKEKAEPAMTIASPSSSLTVHTRGEALSLVPAEERPS